MELITRSDLAKKIGISRQAVTKAVKNNRLRLVGEGSKAKIDLHDVLTVNYMKDNSSNRQVAKNAKKEIPKSTPDSPSDTPDDPEDEPNGPDESVFLRDEKLKIQTRKLKMEMAERVGELITRDEVERVFGQISSSVISYIFPLGDRVSPILAGIYESTDQDKILETKKIIDQEVGRALESVKSDITSALMDIKQ